VTKFTPFYLMYKREARIPATQDIDPSNVNMVSFVRKGRD